MLTNVSESMKRRNPDVFGPPAPTPGSAKGRKGDAKLEAGLQSACESWLGRHGIAYLHLSFRAREKAGWPDLTYVHDGVPYAVELKSRTGTVSEDQERMLAQMRRNGWRTRVIRSYEAFTNMMGEA
ncbi:MAG: hypothetical protein GY851_35470 [bacterium]|nr:hypothetical protein [bacterium]